jgi:hypothetical protein
MPDPPGIVFRIFTEDLPVYRKEVIGVLREHGFPDYTFVRGRGNGPDQSGLENSLVLDVAVQDYSPAVEERMVAAVERICERNGPPRPERPEGGQGSVMLVRIPADVQFISRNKEAGYKRLKPVPFWGRREYQLQRPPRPEPNYRGKILFESGDWKKVLNPELGLVRRGRVVGFFQ